MNEYQCHFCETNRDIALRRLARHYHERTEAFDQTLCRHRNERGIAVPVTPYEKCVSSRFALDLCAELCALGDVTMWELTRAIQVEARRFDEDWEAGRVDLTHWSFVNSEDELSVNGLRIQPFGTFPDYPSIV